MITIAPPLNSENRIESGEAIIVGEDEEGVTKEIHIPIGNGTSTINSIAEVELYKVAEVDNGVKSDITTPTTTPSAEPQKAEGSADITPNGTIELDLKGKIAVKKVTIRVEGTKSKKLADIAKVEFLNDMGNKIPEPKLDVPDNVIANQFSDEKAIITWDHLTNVTGYEVRLKAKIKGKDVEEYHSVQGNMLTLEQIGGTGIKDLTKTEVTVEVRSINGEWKSAYSEATIMKIVTFNRPPKPEYVTVTGAYRELKVSWRETNKADSFDIYYRKYEDGEYIHVNEEPIPGTSTSYI